MDRDGLQYLACQPDLMEGWAELKYQEHDKASRNINVHFHK